MEEIIKFVNIDKKFGGVHALDNVNFSVLKAEVHAIVGENGAGKSTLMNILSGVITPDKGEVIYNGKAVRISNPHAAHELGIGTVFQELKVCENLSITENLFLGNEHTKNGFPDWKKMNAKAKTIMAEYGLDFLDVTVPLKTLSVAQMQMVEIAKAISLDVKVLILDEPTSSLTVRETTKLFENINKLKNDGVTVLFISHRCDEIFEVSDRLTVLRNGKYIGTFGTTDICSDEMVTLIAGKELAAEYQQSSSTDVDYKTKVLEVKDLKRGKSVDNVSFDLFKGEILGFYGLQGSGRTELIETIFGLQKADDGVVKLNGEVVNIKSGKDSIKRGIGMIPEDRKLGGIFSKMHVRDNIAIIHDKKIVRVFGLLKKKAMTDMTQEYIDKLSIKTDGQFQNIDKLSGGNQQKVVISRCLSAEPKILLLDEPTRGVDVGAKAEIYEILKDLRKNEGKSIVLISSELPEIVSLCDRVIVMRNGHIAGELKGDEIGEESILQFAFNG